MPGLWAIFTVIAAAGQVLRNAQQRELTQSLGTVGATHVRFLFGLPFGLLFLVLVTLAMGQAPPALNGAMLAWTAAASLAQIGATALLLAAMRARSFVVACVPLTSARLLRPRAGPRRSLPVSGPS